MLPRARLVLLSRRALCRLLSTLHHSPPRSLQYVGASTVRRARFLYFFHKPGLYTAAILFPFRFYPTSAASAASMASSDPPPPQHPAPPGGWPGAFAPLFPIHGEYSFLSLSSALSSFRAHPVKGRRCFRFRRSVVISSEFSLARARAGRVCERRRDGCGAKCAHHAGHRRLACNATSDECIRLSFLLFSSSKVRRKKTEKKRTNRMPRDEVSRWIGDADE